MHAKLVFLETGSSLLLLNIHSIILDKISARILLHDFFKLYNGKSLDKCDLEYIDYSVWEKTFFNNKSYSNFYKEKFKTQDFIKLNLPYDFPLSNSKTYNSEKINLDLSKEYFNNIEKVANENNVSTYSVFLACLYVLLYKYTYKSDIIVSSPFDGRCFKGSNDIIGNFSNNIFLNEHINPNLSFNSFVKSLNRNLVDTISNNPYSYTSLQKDLSLNENNPLFDIMFDFEKIEPTTFNINDEDIEIFVKTFKENFNSNLYFKINPSFGFLNLEFNKNLFNTSTAKSILSHYLFILKQVIKNQELKISDFEMITPEENRLLEKFYSKYTFKNNEKFFSTFNNEFENMKFYILDKNMKRTPIGISRKLIY